MARYSSTLHSSLTTRLTARSIAPLASTPTTTPTTTTPTTRRPKLAQALVAGVLLLGGSSAFASKPEWVSVAELLVGSLGTSNPEQMSDVMSRCTALNMILSGMASDFSPEMAEHYRNEAHMFIQNNVLIESQMVRVETGAEADIPALSNEAIEEVKGLVDGYNEWLDDNIASSDSYFSKEIDMEIESCQLASKLAARMNAEPAE